MENETDSDKPIPQDVIDKSLSLTLNSRNINSDKSEGLLKKREEILDKHDYTARIRDEDDTLVLHPSDWLDKNGNIEFDEVEDTDNAYEISLSGPNEDANWENIEKMNSELVSKVRDEYNDEHASNVRAFADFMGNHYLKKVTEATEEEKSEFINVYYPRNVWATDKQESVLSESMEILDKID